MFRLARYCHLCGHHLPLQGPIHVYETDVHNHAEDDELIDAESFRSDVKAGVRFDPCRPVKRSYDSAVCDLRRNERGRTRHRQPVQEFHSLRSSLSRCKREGVPNIPRRIDDVNIMNPYDESWSGEQFLVHSDNQWGVQVFATEENLKVLRKCKELYVDGTFRSTPPPFKQFVTIHGKYHGRLLCLASCLLAGKQIGQYRQFFQCLKREVRRITHRRLKPTRVVCDFEQAIILAIETEFTGAKVSGCYFHFCQSLYRKISSIGLATPYRRDQRLGEAIRKCFAVGYLPLAVVRQTFLQFRGSRSIRRLTARYPDLDVFLNYVSSTYFTGPYPPLMWNVYTRDSSNRTNNHVEGENHTKIVLLSIISVLFNTGL
jgi:MULE transposase domain